MPEIKHNFTKGRMNKDLDERLIPDGEYRDAMNIQVSTSEGADVGAAQNILGNNIVNNQEFITENAICVGSVADEKNDKLYWFINDSGTQNLISTNASEFNNGGDQWAHTGAYWDLTNHNAKGVLTEQGYIDTDAPGIVEGRAYRLTYNLTSPTTGGKVYLKNHTTIASTLNSLDDDDHVWVIAQSSHDAYKNNVQVLNGNSTGIHHVDWVQGSSSTGELKLWKSNDFDGVIDNIVITERNRNIIAEYDVKTSNVTPVFVDIIGDVLNFDSGKIITGINIIDGMLFWCDGIDTDGLSTKGTEPKKINIQRSINGTDSSGFFHTNLINPAQGYDMSTNSTRVKEEYITVARKPPKYPLTLQYESFRDPEKTYTGVMNISDNLGNPNLSIIKSSRGFVNDFSFLRVGDTFKTYIQTDITGNPEFTLEWNNWESVVIREFDNDDPPAIPISNYTIKGKVTNWVENSFSNTVSQLVGNTDFEDQSLWSGFGTYWTYNSTNENVEYDGSIGGATGHEKVYTTYAGGGLEDHIRHNQDYAIRWTVGDYNDGSFAGKVFFRIVDKDDKYKIGPIIDAPGTYYTEIKMDGGVTHQTQYGNSWADKFYFESATAYPLGAEEMDATAWTTYTGYQNVAVGGATPAFKVWDVISNTKVIFDGGAFNNSQGATSSNPNVTFLQNVQSPPMDGVSDYTIELTISNYLGAGTVGIHNSGGVGNSFRGSSGSMAIAGTNDEWVGNGLYITGTFTSSSASRIDLFAMRSVTITSVNAPSFEIEVSIKRVEPEEFKGSIDDVTITHISAPSTAQAEIRIDSIDGIPPTVTTGSELKYAIDKFFTDEKLFEYKFPRFAYRYKYDDGEYSVFSPFTEIAFIPSSFNYHPTKGYNLGMVNNLKSLTIKDFNRLLPKDVKSIDILYKEEHSPNIYIVDTIKDLDKAEYKITSETIKNGVIPSNQLLRPWDNVPRKALAQDIVGNRIVYGNYLQNYNLENESNGTDYSLQLESGLAAPKTNNSRVGKKSIKSLREYQIGVVYTDKYGRETPVLTTEEDKHGTIKVDKSLASNINQFQAQILNTSHPLNMKHFKFYVKDTGNEYYNLAMDRFYDAEDDNVWLAFPSTDRNKLDIDDFLILKKGVGLVTNEKDLIKETARYKILDIKNEAPDFIKRKETLIASRFHDNSSNELFKSTDLPAEDDINFSINYSLIQNSSYANLHNDFSKDNDVEYHISLSNDDTNRTSNRYKVTQLAIANSSADWKFTLENSFTNEINSFTNDESGLNSTSILDNTYLNIYKTAVDKSASYKFDGRFFVKIYNDDILKRNIKEKIDEGKKREYKSTGVSRKIYSLETYSGNRIKKHYVSDTEEAFKGVEGNSTNVGLHDKVSNDKTHNDHNWVKYYETTREFARYLGTLNNKKENQHQIVTTGINTRSDQVWRDYDAYFRGINVYLGNDVIKEDRVVNLDIHDLNTTDQKFQDVWFIDEAESAGHFFHSTTHEGTNTGWDTTPYTYFKNSLGITGDGAGHGTLELAFGGIQPTSWSEDPNGDGFDNDPSFYDLAGENINYSESEADFINQIAIGSQFRFKEDPGHEVYTVTNYEMFLRVRYETLLNYCNDETGFVVDHEEDEGDPNKNQLRSQHLFPFHAKAVHGDPSGFDHATSDWNPNGKDANNIHGAVNSTGKGLNTVLSLKDSNPGLIYGTCSYLRPSNYTYNWRLVLDKSFSGKWNPASGGSHPLFGTKKVVLPASATTSSTNSINVLSLSESGNTAENVEVGMVFDKYVEGGTSTVLADTQRAVISKIEKTTPGYTLSFKTYDGTDDLPSGSAGDIDQVVAGGLCRFRQWPMNGLSPNSAKNLNFFRNGKKFNDTKAGTDAVGYTLEWIEEKESRSQEEILPKNPAVWETKPKEGTDLDIYYEASGQIPIEIELTAENILDFIPIGSKVEHEGSKAIPPGTKIKSIDVANQKITLTSKVEVKYDATSIQFFAPGGVTRN